MGSGIVVRAPAVEVVVSEDIVDPLSTSAAPASKAIKINEWRDRYIMYGPRQTQTDRQTNGDIDTCT